MGFVETCIDTWYKAFLKDLEISFEWKISKETNNLDCRDLRGPEKFLLFQHINSIHSLLSECHDVDSLQALWSSFMDIIGDLN